MLGEGRAALACGTRASRAVQGDRPTKWDEGTRVCVHDKVAMWGTAEQFHAGSESELIVHLGNSSGEFFGGSPELPVLAGTIKSA